MKFETGMDNNMEMLQDMESKAMTDMEPPKFERGSGEGKDEIPPKMDRSNVSFGASVEVRARTTELANAKNKIQAEHAARDLAKQLAKEAAAKQAYREKLYGKK